MRRRLFSPNRLALFKKRGNAFAKVGCFASLRVGLNRRLRSPHRAMPCFVRRAAAWWRRATGGLLAMSVSAKRCTRSASSSGGTTSFTSPRRCASAASKRRAVKSRSRLRLSPICKARKADTSAGTKPMRASVKPNFAAGVARVKSQIVARPVPPAMAAPCTAAMVGMGNSYSVAKEPGDPLRVCAMLGRQFCPPWLAMRTDRDRNRRPRLRRRTRARGMRLRPSLQ